MPFRFKAILHNRTAGSSSAVTVRSEPGVLFIEFENSRIVDWVLSDIDNARALDDGSVILQNGKRFLEVRDPAFMTALERSFPKNKLFHRTFFDRVGMMGCLIATLAVLVPMLLIYFGLLPFLAERGAQKVSADVEKQMGDSWFQSITDAYRIDSARTLAAQQFYHALQFETGYDIRITVVQEPVVNAFALPGGHIVVFDSILGIMDSPAQLAGLLAHEASHVSLKHSTRAIFKSLSNHLFFSIILGNYGDVSALVAQHGEELAGLSYSRALELEADLNGLRLMKHSRIPLQGMPDLFRKMQQTTDAGSIIPTFMSTHPAIEERIKITEDRIRESGGELPHTVSPELQALWDAMKR